MSDAAPKPAEGEGGGKKKEGGKGPLLILLVLVFVMNALLVGKIFFSGGKKEAAPHGKEKPKVEIGEKLLLEEFMVNLGGSASSYLKCKVALGLKKDAKAEKMEEEAAPIRDIVVDILASCTRENLKTREAREKLKETIKEKLNEELHDEPVAKVYLTDFATQ